MYIRLKLKKKTFIHSKTTFDKIPYRTFFGNTKKLIFYKLFLTIYTSNYILETIRISQISFSNSRDRGARL